MIEILYQESLCGKRTNNQDAFLVKKFDNNDMILAVADGMGGGVMGAELSQKAISMINTLFNETIKYPKKRLEQAVYDINNTLREMLLAYDMEKKQKPNTSKGGTTLCLVYYSAKKRTITYINIGDSRLSVCEEGKLKNLTIDQNRYEENKLNNDEAKEEDKRLVCAILGISTDSEISDILENKEWFAVGQKTLSCPEDMIILSTDGFHDYIDEEMYCDDFHTNFLGILDVIKRKSDDNITAIVAKGTLC